MLASLHDVLIISTPEDTQGFNRLHGDGAGCGMDCSAVQPSPDGFSHSVMIGEKYLTQSLAPLVRCDSVFCGRRLAGSPMLPQNDGDGVPFKREALL
jgi:glucose-1-phosphate thymidylyltransferase